MLALVAGSLGAFSTLGYCVGRNTETDLRFLEPRRSPTVDEAVIALPIEYSLRSSENNEVIFLGDSTCRCGIDPVEFERVSGLRAYNLGSQGKAGPMAFVLTVKAYLLKHPPPQIVVFSLSPLVCELAGDWRDTRMQDRLLANYGPEVAGLIPRKESLLYFVKRGSVAALAAPSTWIGGPQEDVRDFPLVGLESYTYRSLGRTTRDSRGYGRLPGLHHVKEPGLERRGEPVTILDNWNRGVRLLAETCESAHIPLMFRFSPMPTECSRMRDFAPLEKWTQDLQRSCPELIIGRPTFLWYDWTLCWDPYHLNSQGVAKYTQALASEVRATLEKSGRSDRK